MSLDSFEKSMLSTIRRYLENFSSDKERADWLYAFEFEVSHMRDQYAKWASWVAVEPTKKKKRRGGKR